MNYTGLNNAIELAHEALAERRSGNEEAHREIKDQLKDLGYFIYFDADCYCPKNTYRLVCRAISPSWYHDLAKTVWS